MNRVAAVARQITSSSSCSSLYQAARAMQPYTICLVASGNSAHICAGLIHANTGGKVTVNLLTSRPGDWSTTPKVELPNGLVIEGKLSKISDKPEEVVAGAGMVLYTGPVYCSKAVFEKIQPHVSKECVVGTIFAQGLMHVAARRVFGDGVKFFALRNIPWLCRTVEYGKVGAIVGGKTRIETTSLGVSQEFLSAQVEPLFYVGAKAEPKIVLAADWAPIVFNPANQLIHPAAYWGHFRRFTGTPLAGAERPGEYLYRGMTELAGETLATLDDELQGIKNAYARVTGSKGCALVVPLAQRLVEHYGDQISDRSTMARMVGTNKAYSMAKTPIVADGDGVRPAAQHRVVQDDIGWGLCVLISVAEKLDKAHGVRVPTTMMRMLVEWHQEIMGKEFLVNGKLIGRDCAELVLLREGDDIKAVAGI